MPLVADVSSTILSPPAGRRPLRLPLRRRPEEHGTRRRDRRRGAPGPAGTRTTPTPRWRSTTRSRPRPAPCSTRRRAGPGTSAASCSGTCSTRAAWRPWGRSTSERPRSSTPTWTASAFYANPVDPAARSWMNVPFLLATRRPRRDVPGRGRGGRSARPEGAPFRRRNARQPVQRHARGGRRRADRLPAGRSPRATRDGNPAEESPMFKVLTLNKISTEGLRHLPRNAVRGRLGDRASRRDPRALPGHARHGPPGHAARRRARGRRREQHPGRRS